MSIREVDFQRLFRRVSRPKTLFGWLLLLGGPFWQIMTHWSTGEFVLQKLRIVKPWFGIVLEAAASVSPVWYQGLLTFSGLLWIGYVASRPEESSGQSGNKAISHLDLDWELTPYFFECYREVETPTDTTIRDCIMGPFCPKCGRSLVECVSEYPEDYRIAPKCGTCHRETNMGPLPRGLHLVAAKREVYTEAQRRMRTKIKQV